MQLGVRFLKKRAPVLVALLRVHQHKATIDGGQSVIDDDVDPLAVLPEAEVKDACIAALLKRLVVRHDAFKVILVQGQNGDGCQQPTVANLALVHIEPFGTAAEKDWIIHNLSWT